MGARDELPARLPAPDACSRGRHEILTAEEEVQNVKIPEILTMKAEDMDDTQVSPHANAAALLCVVPGAVDVQGR